MKFIRIAAQLICGARKSARMALADDLLAAVWAREENIADMSMLLAIGAHHGIEDAVAVIETCKAGYAANSQEALSRQVFGAPTYAYAGELVCGQDRLEFLKRALTRS